MGFFFVAQFIQSFSKAVTEGANKEVIFTWVSAETSLLSKTKGQLQKTGSPPVTSLYEKPIEIYEEKDFIKNSNKLIADAVLQCWQAFGSGEMPFLGTDYKDQAFCFPCAQVKFSKKIKDNYPDLDSGIEKIKFSEFIAKPIYKEGPSYNQLLKNKAFLNLNIPKNEDLYIFFVASKGDTWDRFWQSLSSGQVLENIKGIGIVTTVTTRSWKGILFAVPLGYLEPLVAPGNEYFNSAIIMGDPKFISDYCNS